MSELDGDVWMLCSAGRKPIAFGAVHWVCSVSTCNRSRTRLVFCSVSCWDSHVATLHHRDAWAVEERAPGREEHAQERSHERAREAALAAGPPEPARHAPEPAPRRIVAAPPPPPPPVASPAPSGSVTAHAGGPALSNSYEHDDVLIVVSKMKKYVRDRSGMNTSDAVAAVLAEHVRSVCDDAIRAAARDGRKTVLDRDVPKPRR
jgi:hypothetical protein